MHIHFLGTRGEIKPKTAAHSMHTALLFIHRGKRLLIDCGDSWLGKLKKIKPDAILLTHAHPDHAFGLKEGAPCPVFASKETWKLIDRFPIPLKQRRLLLPRHPEKICGISCEAFPVDHSIRCPAVGYRLIAGKVKLFFCPDVAWIHNVGEAFKGIQLYIGDGATIVRSMVRKAPETETIFGHAPIRQQLTWCHKQGVPKMIITHCGSDIVKDEEKARLKIDKLAAERGVAFEIAYDGLTLNL